MKKELYEKWEILIALSKSIENFRFVYNLICFSLYSFLLQPVHYAKPCI